MEPEGSLPHSQVPATCPYPEPARSSSYPHIPFPENPPYYYLPIYAWDCQMVSFPQVSPPKSCIHLFSPPYALHAPPISLLSVLSPEKYWVRNTDHSASHCAASLTPLLPRSSQALILTSVPYSQTPIACVPPSVSATNTTQHNRQSYTIFTL